MTATDESPPPARSTASTFAGAAALIMLGNVLSRLLAIGREIVASYYFGLSSEMGAFTIADNVRTMLYDLLIAGMISAALVPVLSDLTQPERRAELRRVVTTLLLITALGAGVIVGLLMLVAPQVVSVMTALVVPGGVVGGGSGTSPEPGLTTTLVRAILPSVWLLCLAAVLLAALQALRRFRYYSLSLLVPNAALIGAALLWHDQLGIMSLVVGTVLGAASLVLLGLPGLRDLWPPTGVAPRHPVVRRIGRLYGPIFLGLIVTTVKLVIDRNLASALGSDALAAMRYATQVQQMVLGLVAAAIALATLPTLAAQAGANNLTAFRGTLSAGLRLVTLLSVPATLGLLAMAGPITTLLFRRGATDEIGAAAIGLALLGYLPGIPAAAIDQLLIFAYYARQNTRTPMLVGVLSAVLFLVAALLLTPLLHMLGLVLANSIEFILHACVMLWLIRRSLGGLGWREHARLLGRSLVAAIPMAGLAAGLAWGLTPVPGFAGDLVRVVLPASAGVAVYLWIASRLGIDDLAEIGRLARRRLGR